MFGQISKKSEPRGTKNSPNPEGVSREDAKMGCMANPQAMIVTPTRELADQIYKIALQLNQVAEPRSQLSIVQLIGGLPLESDLTNLKLDPEVIIGTTGRIQLHLSDNNLGFGNLRLFIADEADVLLKAKDFRRLFGSVRHERDKRPL